MEKLKKLFLLIVVLATAFSCSKSDQPELIMSGLSVTNPKGQSILQDAIFVVEPNGIDETEALSEAFTNAINYGHGSVVQLEEGEYHINFIEIREFYGKFIGAGKGKTVITTVEDLDVDELLDQSLNTLLIKFVGGDVLICDMTIKTPPGPLSTGSTTRIKGLVGIHARTYQYTSQNEYINAVINNVEFLGNLENTNEGIVISGFDIVDARTDILWPLSNMDVSITNCFFNGFSWYGALIELFKGGKIIVGTKNNGNIFSNIGEIGHNSGGSIGLWSNVNVDIFIERNTFFIPEKTRYGIELFSSPIPRYLEQVEQTKVTVCNIEQNEFNIDKGWGGILTNDRRRHFYPEDLPMFVQVKNNRFNLSNDASSGITCNNMFGMVIRNNRFEGNGQYGIRIWGTSPYPYNENGLMLGNNLSNATFSVASVLLDTRTKNWTIVGGNLGESVLDNTLGEGYHIITGMNVFNIDVSPGQTIVDNLQEMRDALHEGEEDK